MRAARRACGMVLRQVTQPAASPSSLPVYNRLERLRGEQSDRHSMRINDQYRLTFRWEDGHAYDVRVEDYH